ncbi:lamin tail domain-containing protein [Bythopirellula goksoeyrii]|uniref:LTD domain-containing protein n=1 Tax=Bythopirellula goksoeyrii TaxID=1400387 RepID=A0A5B9Q4X1_9BACT|nr:lamin tail domain-containing protein [Bythopirellula goksoeyrii]QEG34027.1 hypothetical protein Pr1d_12990 [Bythopirellula goksoeyrii]
MRIGKQFLTILSIVGMLSATMAIAPAAIIISQYYEGASFDKYIELHNTGPAAVDLAAGLYNLSHWSNAAREDWKTGGSPTGTQSLTGVIPVGGTYLVAHSSAATPAYALPADAADGGNGGVNFNGDDSSVLWTGAAYAFASVVDAFGATANAFGNTSYVRNANITSGTNLDFDASQWTQFSNDDVNNAATGTNQRLGEHSIIPEPASITLLIGCLGVMTIRRR